MDNRPSGLIRANELFQQAVAKDPNYAQAYAWYCETVVLSGDDAGALESCRTAVELDPVGLIPNLLLSVPLSGLGQRKEALAQIDRTLDLYPGVAMARFFHAGLLLKEGLSVAAAESLEALGRAVGFSDPGSLRQIAAAWPGVQPSPVAIEVVRRMERELGGGQYYLAALYDWAGAEPEAVRVVERAVADLNPWLGIAAVFPEYDGLRGNPEFQAILERKGLPNGNTAWREGSGRSVGG
jgi:hypothetical protein